MNLEKSIAMEGKIKYEFLAKMWQYAGPNGWYFVSLPTDMALEIRENLKWQEEGLGRMKARAKIGKSQWDTAIWFDKKHNTYLLPLKAEIRKKEVLESDDEISIMIWI
ncbi:MAG: DUF1905 domain-containing protein [Saprospiraceae bacterium]|nr:DUF1905 domain-containing protein [Saprospiraceae bacterium]